MRRNFYDVFHTFARGSSFREVFGEGYQRLKGSIAGALNAVNQQHGGNVAVTLERAVRVLSERRQFWSRFAEIPVLNLDTVTIIRAWQHARDMLMNLPRQKQASPLERIAVSEAVPNAVDVHERNRSRLADLNSQIEEANEVITGIKQRAATANPAALAATLRRLRAIKSRHSPQIAALWEEYLAELRAKGETEQQRDTARAALEQYRANIFPRYQGEINRHLARFNAGFHLDDVAPTKHGAVQLALIVS